MLLYSYLTIIPGSTFCISVFFPPTIYGCLLFYPISMNSVVLWKDPASLSLRSEISIILRKSYVVGCKRITCNNHHPNQDSKRLMVDFIHGFTPFMILVPIELKSKLSLIFQYLALTEDVLDIK